MQYTFGSAVVIIYTTALLWQDATSQILRIFIEVFSHTSSSYRQLKIKISEMCAKKFMAFATFPYIAKEIYLVAHRTI